MAEDAAKKVQEQTPKMNAIQRIGNLITAITGRVCYIHTTAKPDINWLLQNTELPCAYLFEQETKNEVLAGGQIVQRVRVGVFFVAETKAQFNTDVTREIVENERVALLGWFAEVKRRAEWQTWTMIDSSDIYDGSTRLVAGYALNVEAVELYGVCADGGGLYERVLKITHNGEYDVVSYDKVEVDVPAVEIREQNKLWLNVESEEGYIIVNERQ